MWQMSHRSPSLSPLSITLTLVPLSQSCKSCQNVEVLSCSDVTVMIMTGYACIDGEEKWYRIWQERVKSDNWFKQPLIYTCMYLQCLIAW